MSEQAQDRLTQLLVDQVEKFEGAVDKGVDFAMEQAPELVQQLLLWHGVSSFIEMLAGMAILAASYLVIRQAIGNWRELENRNLDIPIGVSCMVGAPLGVGLGLSMVLQLKWLKILIAPKLYLFEYVAELVK